MVGPLVNTLAWTIKKLVAVGCNDKDVARMGRVKVEKQYTHVPLPLSCQITTLAVLYEEINGKQPFYFIDLIIFIVCVAQQRCLQNGH